MDPEVQEKTTFTCPFGTLAYRRIPFGLCNALATQIRLNVTLRYLWMTSLFLDLHLRSACTILPWCWYGERRRTWF
jgi:hypothetical protein